MGGSAQKVQEALSAGGFDNRGTELPDSTRTAREAAEAIGCTVGQIAESLVFKGDEALGIPVGRRAAGPAFGAAGTRRRPICVSS